MKNKGITLIALVITIIVLLILAGITISLTIGNQGVITRAQQAAKNYKDAEQKEQEELDNFNTELNDIVTGLGTTKPKPLSGIQPGQIVKETKKDNYVDANSDIATIPAGFTVSGIKEEQNIDNGLVIYDIPENETVENWNEDNDNNGIKDVQEKYNQFVWIPVDNINDYKRVAWDDYVMEGNEIYQIQGSIRHVEEMPDMERISVQEYKGYYIGRYETGIIDYTSSNVIESNSDKLDEFTGYQDGKLVVRKRCQVWNYTTRNKSLKEAEKLYTKASGDSVNSRLCSSYSWDTAVSFITEKNSNITGINYKNFTFEYIDLDGTTKTKETGVDTPVPTGQTKPLNNIYDMAGNYWEWTSETTNNEKRRYAVRGRCYMNEAESARLGARGTAEETTSAYVTYGCRITLFI